MARARPGSTMPEAANHERVSRARAARRIGIGVLMSFLLLGATNVFGVRSQTVSASGGGYELTVTYAAVSRPGLATPWDVEVRHPGGFDGPITIATSGHYLGMFDENGLDPDPSSSTATGDLVIWEFEPPSGETLRVSFDARLEPAVQVGRVGETSVLEDGRGVVRVEYTTRVMP
jgi:hypothetical protein